MINLIINTSREKIIFLPFLKNIKTYLRLTRAKVNKLFKICFKKRNKTYQDISENQRLELSRIYLNLFYIYVTKNITYFIIIYL